MKDMGVEVIRLYDWDPRNDHHPFLDLCRTQGIGVLVSVSNWFLQPGGGLPARDANSEALIRSFSNQAGTDYHAAVVGIVIGNEFDGYSIADCATFTNSLVEIENSKFGGYRKVRIGHPLAFIKQGQFPCWHAWGELLPKVSALGQRLFLAPQTYNTADYLFANAEGSGKGWVEQTWDKYKVPIWFTEIGQDRTKPNYQTVVDQKLSACLAYAGQHPEQLLGAWFFGFGDKIWISGTSEGSFGAYSHQRPGPCTITFSEKDFTHWDVAPNWGTLNVDVLSETPLHGVVKTRYAG